MILQLPPSCGGNINYFQLLVVCWQIKTKLHCHLVEKVGKFSIILQLTPSCGGKINYSQSSIIKCFLTVFLKIKKYILHQNAIWWSICKLLKRNFIIFSAKIPPMNIFFAFRFSRLARIFSERRRRKKIKFSRMTWQNRSYQKKALLMWHI